MDYWEFLAPRIMEAWRLLSPQGTLYLHLDWREVHYAKVALDQMVGREHFLNEIIWAYDYGAKSNTRWPTKHDTILVYVKDPSAYIFNSDQVDREPYMAPGLVDADKAARGNSPLMSGGTPSCPLREKRRPATPHKNLSVFCDASSKHRPGPATGYSILLRGAEPPAMPQRSWNESLS